MRKIAVGFVVLVVGLAVVRVSMVEAAKYPVKRLTYNVCFNPGGPPVR